MNPHKDGEFLAHGTTNNFRVGFTGALMPGKPKTEFAFSQLSTHLTGYNHPSEHCEVHSEIYTPSRQ